MKDIEFVSAAEDTLAELGKRITAFEEKEAARILQIRDDQEAILALNEEAKSAGFRQTTIDSFKSLIAAFAESEVPA